MEFRDLYNENKIPTGKTFIKGEQIPKGYYYLIVIIIIQNSKDEFLIQKRVKRKGGKWALTGGHPTAGQTSIEGIITEVQEELGIKLNTKELNLIKTVYINDQIFDLYYVNTDIKLDEIIIQKEELDDVKWATLDEILTLNEHNHFHEGHFKLFNEYLNKTIDKRLK